MQTNNEVELILNITLEYKTNKTHREKKASRRRGDVHLSRHTEKVLLVKLKLALLWLFRPFIYGYFRIRGHKQTNKQR